MSDAYSIQYLYFQNIKRKVGINGQDFNMGFEGKTQRSGVPKMLPIFEISRANILKSSNIAVFSFYDVTSQNNKQSM